MDGNLDTDQHEIDEEKDLRNQQSEIMDILL